MTSSGAASPNPNRYSGRPDDQTGLFYHRARYYDPRFAKFASEDPAGPHDGLNLYAYVGNSPINFVDTDGLYRTTKDFPPELRADVDAAMALLKQKLTDTCCAGKKTANLLKKASDPNLLIGFKETTDWCGYTGFRGMLGVQNKLALSRLAWKCCTDATLFGTVSLASTILHELRHQGFGRESSSEDVEVKCFGCRTK